MEDRVVEITVTATNKEKIMKKTEESLRDLWVDIKHTNICIIGVPEGEEREKGPEKIFEEIITQNFPNMGEKKLTQVEEAQRIPYKISPRRNTARGILIKLKKEFKEKILRATNQIKYKESSIRTTADLSEETLQARREW